MRNRGQLHGEFLQENLLLFQVAFRSLSESLRRTKTGRRPLEAFSSLSTPHLTPCGERHCRTRRQRPFPRVRHRHTSRQPLRPRASQRMLGKTPQPIARAADRPHARLRPCYLSHARVGGGAPSELLRRKRPRLRKRLPAVPRSSRGAMPISVVTCPRMPPRLRPSTQRAS